MTKSEKNRRKYTEMQDRELLDETGGLCPLCGHPLVKKKNGRRMPVYERAHIYPHSPTPDQEEILKGVPKPDDVESLENIVLLCHDCHGGQDFWTTREDYLKLYTKKQELIAKNRARYETAYVDLESELKMVLGRLAVLDDSELVELSFKPLAVTRKIEKGALQRKVLSLVTTYYETLKHLFQKADNLRSSTFEMIANQFRQAFLKQEREYLFLNKEQVFDGLVDWVRSKTDGSRAACEAAVSFFIQNCEVFNEISE